MSILNHVLAVYRFNLVRWKLLTDDIKDDEFTLQPAGLNHPAWIIGHVTSAREWVKDFLHLADRPGWNGPAWLEKFNRGTNISPERSKYPTKAELLAALEAMHQEVETAVLKLSEADFTRDTPDPRIRQMFPKVGDILVGLMTTHEAFHMGQLSAWRRATGRKPLF
jgi:hypothetical protein